MNGRNGQLIKRAAARKPAPGNDIDEPAKLRDRVAALETAVAVLEKKLGRIHALEKTIAELSAVLRGGLPVMPADPPKRKRKSKPILHPRIIRNRETLWIRLQTRALMAGERITKAGFATRDKGLSLRELFRWFSYHVPQIQAGSGPDQRIRSAIQTELDRIEAKLAAYL